MYNLKIQHNSNIILELYAYISMHIHHEVELDHAWVDMKW